MFTCLCSHVSENKVERMLYDNILFAQSDVGISQSLCLSAFIAFKH